MKFIVDAQLPRQMIQWLATHGHDAVHTLDLPAKNATPDRLVTVAADQMGRVVITKDNDFAESQVRHGQPKRLVHVKTGNISNRELIAIFGSFLDAIVAAFDSQAVSVRLTKQGVEIVHADDQ